MGGRAAAPAAAAQADAVRRAPLARARSDDIRPRPARLGRRTAGWRAAGANARDARVLHLRDLAPGRRPGGAVAPANDECFAPKEGLINPAAPVWIEGKYTERGKWMDGWETRRRRDGGDHDWCIVRLGVPGVVRGVDVETTFFKGNFPESCAVDACDASPLAAADELSRVSWREVVPRTILAGDSHNPIAAAAEGGGTHARLRIFPDGGGARLRAPGAGAPA